MKAPSTHPEPIPEHCELINAAARNPQRTARKQERIAEGSCKVFFAKGFHRATIRELALACGMSMGQLYHYVSSKDDVLFLVYQHMQKLWRDHLENSRLTAIPDPRKRLERALLSTLEFTEEHHDLFLFVYTETKYLEPRHLRQVLASDDQGVVGLWRELLTGLKPALDPELAANLIAFLLMFPVLRGWNLDPALREQNPRETVGFILRGLGLEPRPGGEDEPASV